MTNTHRKTTTSTTAKIAAVGAFGIGAAIAFPGLAAAQTDPAPTADTGTLQNVTGEDGSLENLTGDDGSLANLPGGDASVEALLDTDLSFDVGSLTLNLHLDADAPNPGSVEFGSLGVSPNTGSALIDGDSGSGDGDSGSGSVEDDAPSTDGDNGSPSASLADLS